MYGGQAGSRPQPLLEGHAAGSRQAARWGRGPEQIGVRDLHWGALVEPRRGLLLGRRAAVGSRMRGTADPLVHVRLGLGGAAGVRESGQLLMVGLHSSHRLAFSNAFVLELDCLTIIAYSIIGQALTHVTIRG